MTRYTTEQLATFPWIVSTGTLRTDHLADAYLGAFDRLGQDVPEPFRSDLQQCAAYASDPTGPEPCDAWEIATAWAFDRLGELAPTGFYFGASEGDGACFGFWLCEDWADALEDRGIDCEDPAGTAELIQAFDDHGIEAEQLCDAYCGTADEVRAWRNDKSKRDRQRLAVLRSWPGRCSSAEPLVPGTYWGTRLEVTASGEIDFTACQYPGLEVWLAVADYFERTDMVEG